MQDRRIVVAGTSSGVGKTTVTLGLMSALRKKGLTVQGFKCGPDYIDPSYHTALTKRFSRNLDSWMLRKETVLDIFLHGSRGADISVIEGVMGLYDGKDPKTNKGSTAEISTIIESPVLLVVNGASMARSAAAIVKGFQTFAKGPHIGGVVVNNVGSEGHFKLLKIAIEETCKIPVIGYLERKLDIEIPERTLGLIPAIGRGELDDLFNRLGDSILETFDLERLLEISRAKPIEKRCTHSLLSKKNEKVVKIAVAKDQAFHSYYLENLELLESFGAELFFFSPLANEALPEDVDGLYIGGSLPEEFVPTLAKNTITKETVKEAIQLGIPTLAECGGFMYLTEAIETTSAEQFAMVGLIPGKVKVHPKWQALGYREIIGLGSNFLLKEKEQQKARGHQFHYTTFSSSEEITPSYETIGRKGMKKEGFLKYNLVAGYTQFHFASNPEVAKNWIRACMTYREGIL